MRHPKAESKVTSSLIVNHSEGNTKMQHAMKAHDRGTGCQYLRQARVEYLQHLHHPIINNGPDGD